MLSEEKIIPKILTFLTEHMKRDMEYLIKKKDRQTQRDMMEILQLKDEILQLKEENLQLKKLKERNNELEVQVKEKSEEI